MNYKLDEYGIWEAKGEDPNADFGGLHSCPSLGFYEGTYQEVLNYAQTLKGWTCWGRGGHLNKINVTKVDKESVEKIMALKARKVTLEQELERIKDELGI